MQTPIEVAIYLKSLDIQVLKSSHVSADIYDDEMRKEIFSQFPLILTLFFEICPILTNKVVIMQTPY